MPVDSLTKVLYPAGDANQKDKPTSPYYRLWRMIVEDKQDLFLILIYSSLAGVLSLAVPLSTQMVVNTIAAGFFLQPITVIAGLVLGGLLFAAILRLLTIWLVELVRQRVFNRIALRIAYRVPRIQHSTLSKEYLPDLVNRFFDVITIQGNFANLLLDVAGGDASNNHRSHANGAVQPIFICFRPDCHCFCFVRSLPSRFGWISN